MYLTKSKFGSTKGIDKFYGQSGYVLKGDSAARKLQTLKNIDLARALVKLELEAVIIHALYYVPSYDTWISNAIVFEFPRDNEITKVVRIDPIVLKNYNHDRSAKLEYFLEIGIMLLSFVIMVTRLTIDIKSMNPKALR